MVTLLTVRDERERDFKFGRWATEIPLAIDRGGDTRQRGAAGRRNSKVPSSLITLPPTRARPLPPARGYRSRTVSRKFLARERANERTNKRTSKRGGSHTQVSIRKPRLDSDETTLSWPRAVVFEMSPTRHVDEVTSGTNSRASFALSYRSAIRQSAQLKSQTFPIFFRLSRDYTSGNLGLRAIHSFPSHTISATEKFDSKL